MLNKSHTLLPDQTDIDEHEWLRAAATNPAFDFLKEPEEDIYLWPTENRPMNKGKATEEVLHGRAYDQRVTHRLQLHSAEC